MWLLCCDCCVCRGFSCYYDYCSGCVVIMAVVVMVVAAAAMAAVALWLLWVLRRPACVNTYLYTSLCVHIYIHKSACACVYSTIFITAARSHTSNVFCLASCCLCTYPLIYLFVYFVVELRQGISSTRLHEMSLCASRGCLCIAEASRMVACRVVDWTKGRHAQRMAALQ